MNNDKPLSEYFYEDGWLKPEYLWELRQQISLGSLYVSDYRNTFGIDEEKVCDFFTSFWDSYCEELAEKDGLYEKAKKELREEYPDASDSEITRWVDNRVIDEQRARYDNEETLKEWYGCFSYGPDDDPADGPLTITKINVDVHWDFAKSFQIIARDEEEAEEIIHDMISDGQITPSMMEATDDYELDTTYQP